jgi:hypothetical protein
VIRLTTNFILPAAYSLLPQRMESNAASAMLIAIAMQESRMKHRRQIRGPARSYWQFELGGVMGVLRHRASAAHAQEVCDLLNVEASPSAVYTAIEHNDILAACMARLLLFTLPYSLPDEGDPEGGWNQYIDAWRPGKPHRNTWDAFYKGAWEEIQAI